MPSYAIGVPANPEAIKWGRVHAKLAAKDAAEATGLARLTTERLIKIESGEIEPTISEVMAFSKIYKRPFALFFLPAAPSPIPDLSDMRSGAEYGSDTKGDLGIAISRAYEVQDLLSDLQGPVDVPVPPSDIRNNAGKLAHWLQQQLSIEKVFEPRARKPQFNLEHWISVIESLGAVVLQETYSPRDAGGFSLGTLNPPVIVLCYKDAERRRLYSLFHEVCHVLLRQSAICDPTFSRHEKEERFCDEFAAQFLMPEAEARDLVSKFDIHDLDLLATKLSLHSGASEESAFLRLVDLNLATMDDYWLRKPRWRNGYLAWLRQQRLKKGGPNPNPVGTAIRKGGRLLSASVSEAFQSGRISRVEASHILRLPAKQIPTLIKAIR